MVNDVKSEKNLPISNYSLYELLSRTLTTVPAVSTTIYDRVWETTGMLVHHLESFTDSLVVTDETHPVGLIGGVEIMSGTLKNPAFDFFNNTLVGKIKNDGLVITTPETKLSDLLKQWKQTGRAFAIIPNQYHGYSAISSRKLLEVGVLCNTDIKVDDIPKKRMVTFKQNQTVREIINAMFENKTRRLILENTTQFLSDRIIIEKIATDLNYLRDVDNFLDMKASIFKLESAKTISPDMKIPEVCKIMYGMLHPYVITTDQVISPWDLIMVLTSKELTSYKWQKTN
ncbi:MAG TPA: CBS domain-containing protein [Nitrosopumilaceae archaeon]|nr:CBS domain-containing protein [Nitrosopumilaceae archaeon]